ncbi:transcription regulator NOT2/NOT3/NOT5 family protein [Arabidopsis thaliana]|jgi:CCR4-NOT transcription complex subunit 3|uniref:Transcription regulator NOT2/NOT3/NOT5 family protein n=1 Tax=Arabidopsis thaliana TaxID=3702 RepID=F4JWJ7_ARATH|nr:transcription regulator NOT2/NOT3/NOT5 family protein [Arabidopsis thaliana]AED92522.1 transcription regulator NOT2/NOT3/NOT5 family protein [Arabidopsis thaliana]|eukprot:NP_001154716.1 transcription regulator NOT2/NOT3/NOT5 family protein [Arabidopsis thaliana]
MGASRKLQGEIDRVLKKVQEGVDVFDSIWNKWNVYDTDNVNQKEKFEADLKKEIKKLQRYRDQIKTWIQSSEIKDKKVSASYEQSLVDARKLIEKEMERFKICEKETKTKAFSKEGLGQQPKTDPKEKAKSETRDWLNNVVSELESQIDSFEAELEGLSVKKGKTRPPRLTHLETSITRHKDHIIKLELILRLLDNDELSPEQVNDVKDFLDDYVERNQDDFDEFSDVDELYSTLPLDEVEGLEDLVTAGPLVKGTPLSMKSSLAASASQVRSISLPTHHQEKTEDTSLPDSSAEMVPKTPPPKNGAGLHSAPSTPAGGRPSLNVPAGNVSNTSVTLSTSIPTQTSIESMGSLSPVAAKEEDATTLPSRKPPSSVADTPLRGIGRVGIPNQPQPSQPPSPIPANGSRISATSAAEVAKRNIMGVESNVQPLTSPLSKMVLPPTAKGNDGTASDSNPGDVAASIGRAFSPSIVSGSQWRPGSPFQSQNETVRGRTEIAPDQREKFLQRLQQVQQGHGNLLGIPSLSGGNEKQFSSQQQNPLLQQSSSISPHGSLGIGVQAPGFNVMSSASLQQQSNAMSQQLGQQPSVADVDHVRNDDQSQQNLPDDSASIAASKAIQSEDDSKVLFDTPSGMPSYMLDPVQVSSGPDFSPGQPIQPGQSSSSLGVIGRRSNSELGAIGDPSAVGPMHDQMHNLQMLEAAFYKRPQPSDSERPRPYSPRNPAITPQTFPQTQAPIINNPLLWERLGSDAYGTDTLFFAFYYQQNSYQQYLAAKELKKQSWRYHRKFNTWFQRHKEPKIATDEYEQGAYVYFDFQTPKDENQEGGWCQRIKNEFTFEYSYLEDELVV